MSFGSVSNDVLVVSENGNNTLGLNLLSNDVAPDGVSIAITLVDQQDLVGTEFTLSSGALVTVSEMGHGHTIQMEPLNT